MNDTRTKDLCCTEMYTNFKPFALESVSVSWSWSLFCYRILSVPGHAAHAVSSAELTAENPETLQRRTAVRAPRPLLHHLILHWTLWVWKNDFTHYNLNASSSSNVTMVLWRCCDCAVMVLWRWCDGAVTVLWRWCDDGVTMVWRCCEGAVSMLWRWCEDAVTVLWALPPSTGSCL